MAFSALIVADMEPRREGKRMAAYRASNRRFSQRGARFLIFSVLFLAITLAVLALSILLIAGAWDLEGDNDRASGATFLVVSFGLLGFYWWMVSYLTRENDEK